MPWNDTDRVTLARLLKLEDSQYYQAGLLQYLMNCRQQLDDETGATFVADIQKLIRTVSLAENEAEAAITQQSNSDSGLIELTLFGETRKRYDKDLLILESASNSPEARIESFTNEIKRLLDPQNKLARVSIKTRTIPT